MYWLLSGILEGLQNSSGYCHGWFFWFSSCALGYLGVLVFLFRAPTLSAEELESAFWTEALPEEVPDGAFVIQKCLCKRFYQLDLIKLLKSLH